MQNALKTQMKKHAKIVVLSLAGVAIALAGTVAFFSRLEPSTVGKTIPYLAALNPKDESDMLTSFASPRTGTLTRKTHTTRYFINEKYETVRDALKKDLKSRSSSASSYPPKNSEITLFNLGAPGAAGAVTVSIHKTSEELTTVGVVESRSLNPLDRAKLWYAGVTSKRKGGILVVTNSKTNPLYR